MVTRERCCRWKVIVGLLGTLIVMLLLAACCYYCCGGAYVNYGSTRGSFFTIRRRAQTGASEVNPPSPSLQLLHPYSLTRTVQRCSLVVIYFNQANRSACSHDFVYVYSSATYDITYDIMV